MNDFERLVRAVQGLAEIQATIDAMNYKLDVLQVRPPTGDDFNDLVNDIQGVIERTMTDIGVVTSR
jgi:hypothetical protein